MMEDIRKLAEELYNFMQPYCTAIYLGGSITQKYIKNPHDIDLICFGKLPVDMCHIRRRIYIYQQNHNIDKDIDLVQIRNERNEERVYGSYIYRDMILLAGNPVNFTFDPLNKDRKEYIKILLELIDKFDKGLFSNQKRWYHILRGYYLLKNNSYDLTEEQKEIINKAHDKQCEEKYKLEAKQWLQSQIL